MDFFINAANAMSAPGGAKPGASAPGGFETFLPFIIIIAVFYLIVFLPQRKEKKKRETLLQNLKPGDKIITTSGIYGEISKIENDIVFIKVSENNTKLKMLKSAVSIVLDANEQLPKKN